MKILGTGLSGLVGSRIQELLKDKYQFENLSRTTGVDISDKKRVFSAISSSDSSLVLHLAAKADVDGCEKDKKRDKEISEYEDTDVREITWAKEKTAWGINVIGTKNVVDACLKLGKKLIYISTDFVFDGKKLEPYIEEDISSPICWYGQTKLEGERIVMSSSLDYVILRIAYPYRAIFPRADFVRILIKKLSSGEKLRLIADHIMTPTLADDLPSLLETIINKNLLGIFHAVGSQPVSPFDAGVIIADIFGFDKNLLQKTTRKEFFKDRAQRPFNLALKNDKIQKLGIKMKSFEDGVLEIKNQLSL